MPDLIKGLDNIEQYCLSWKLFIILSTTLWTFSIVEWFLRNPNRWLCNIIGRDDLSSLCIASIDCSNFWNSFSHFKFNCPVMSSSLRKGPIKYQIKFSSSSLLIKSWRSLQDSMTLRISFFFCISFCGNLRVKWS